MRNSYLIFFLILNTFNSIPVKSQSVNATSNLENKIIVQHRFKDGSVSIRWGVKEKNSWKLGNKYGYIIERTTINTNGEIPIKKMLTAKPIKPKPLMEWETLATNNDMAAIVAQAIYGEDFQVNSNNENQVLRIINESSELQQRFGFSMFAVDQDFEVARFAGLGFIDENIDTSKRYLYKIKMAAPVELLKVEENGFVLDPSTQETLPKPYDLAGYYYNDAFVLIWEYDALRNFYNSYYLEKSEDGINFTKVNKLPITKLENTEVSGISYTDSLQQYEKKYWYRIIGKTIFDEFSLPSDTISIMAHKKLRFAPELTKSEIISDKEVILKWTFPQEEVWKVKNFEILRANNPIGPYSEIVKNLPSEQKSYRYQQLQNINYFKIRAKSAVEEYQDSSPLMVQPIDSIPPNTPKGLTGTVDSLGVIKLSWNENLELDLKGYSIFRANRINQEFSKINKLEIYDTSFTDTINLNTFNKKVYYKIVALDNRYNESLPSETLELTRADTIPPGNPLFENYVVKDEGILLSWLNSSSEDVSKHILYRKKVDNDEEFYWENIFETKDLTTCTFLDKEIQPNSKYLYTVLAVDRTGLESDPSPPISVSSFNRLLNPEIKGFYAEANRQLEFIQLSWRYTQKNVFEFKLFRKEQGKEYKLYQTLEKNRRNYSDYRIIPNSIYSYGIIAILDDGSVSKWVELKVKY